MNDFTKEELQLIHDYVKGNIKTYAIADKIQSMIDNYCKHEHIVTGAYPRSNPPKKCESCGALYYDNQ